MVLNGAQVIDAWKAQIPAAYFYTTSLIAGTFYDIELHYYERTGRAACNLQLSYAGQSTQTITRLNYPKLRIRSGKL